jgi:hypothetical protein
MLTHLLKKEYQLCAHWLQEFSQYTLCFCTQIHSSTLIGEPFYPASNALLQLQYTESVASQASVCDFIQFHLIILFQLTSTVRKFISFNDLSSVILSCGQDFRSDEATLYDMSQNLLLPLLPMSCVVVLFLRPNLDL